MNAVLAPAVCVQAACVSCTVGKAPDGTDETVLAADAFCLRATLTAVAAL